MSAERTRVFLGGSFHYCSRRLIGTSDGRVDGNIRLRVEWSAVSQQSTKLGERVRCTGHRSPVSLRDHTIEMIRGARLEPHRKRSSFQSLIGDGMPCSQTGWQVCLMAHENN